MKEVIFTIDEATGALTVRVKGVAGKACAPIASLVEEFLGQAATHVNTTEYNLVTEAPKVTPRRS